MKIGIITDIHENVGSLSSSLRLAGAHKCDELVCLGDIVGYDNRFFNYYNSRSAKICLELVRSHCRWIVAGNHDLFAAGRLPSFTNGFIYPSEWFKLSPENRKITARGKVWSYEADAPNDLGEDDVSFLGTIPEHIIVSLSGISCLFSHYIFPDFTGSATKYIERNHQLREAWEFMTFNSIQLSFSGHSHSNFTGFAYPNSGSLLKAIHPIPSNNFNLGEEMGIIILPPLSGEEGKTGFSIFDSDSRKLMIFSKGIA